MRLEQEQERRGAQGTSGETLDELSPKHLARRLIALLVFAALVAGAISALPGLGTLRERFSLCGGLAEQ